MSSEISRSESQLNKKESRNTKSPEREKRGPFSFQLLRRHGDNNLRKLNNKKVIQPTSYLPSSTTPVTSTTHDLSTDEIMRLAGARFLQASTQTVDVVSMLDNPFDFSVSEFKDEDTKKVELVQLLFSAAERVGSLQFERATRLLDLCDVLASNNGNTIERLVYYFSRALRERVHLKTSVKQGQSNSDKRYQPIKTSIRGVTAYQMGIPFPQVAHFVGIQAIIDHVGVSTKIHVIDLDIRNGQQWSILMQALASRVGSPVELLKITAIMTNRDDNIVEETGKRLESFAEVMNIPFKYNVVNVSDFLELNEGCFELDQEEAVAVFSDYFLRTLIASQETLDWLMKVIKNLNPCIVVVNEVEANHNSPTFVHRFVEVLFFVSAYLDCLDSCMESGDPNKMIMESMFLGEAVRNSLTMEGKDRRWRNVKLDVWRAYFAQCGMEESELSMSALYQAKLIAHDLPAATSCTFHVCGKSLITGWKGTPIQSLSTWKFITQQHEHQQELEHDHEH